MNEITSFQKVLTRFLLIGSIIIFAAGAAVPALGNFWSMSLEEGLKWIEAHPGGYAFSSVSFVVSLMLCVAGLAIFNQYFPFGDAQSLTRIGFFTYLIGSIFWILVVGFRLSVAP